MYGEADRASLQSEDTESVHSTAENAESAAAVDEIVNPQGVRFTPHHHHKEGRQQLDDGLSRNNSLSWKNQNLSNIYERKIMVYLCGECKCSCIR